MSSCIGAIVLTQQPVQGQLNAKTEHTIATLTCMIFGNNAEAVAGLDENNEPKQRGSCF